MPMYRYKALNENGHTIRGTLQGVNEEDISARLESVGLDPYYFKEQKTKKLSSSTKVTPQDLIVLCVQLEQLERAGVPLLDSISDIRDTVESIGMKNLLSDVYESVRSGNMLSAALAMHPEVFDNVFVGLIAAGEKTGQLSAILSHLGAHLKWVNDVKKKIKKAMYYPLFLLLLMSGVITVMMLFVIPQLTEFLLSQNFELPIYTTALIATSNAFKEYWPIILGTPVVVVFIIKTLIRTMEPVAYLADRIKLSLPVVGSTIRKTEMAKFCRFFAITFRSGIGILDCLDVGASIIGNRIIKESVVVARRSVAEGNSLNGSFRISHQFPNLVLRMFKVGENSGNLDASLETVNFFYDKEVAEAVDSMIAVIQPMLTVVMGGIMLWISLAVFGPLYGSFSNMNF